jgi:hypothetical protein
VDERSLAVVGIGFANADRGNLMFELLLCIRGEPVELRPEPKNKHDRRAIAVFSKRGIPIGYITAERAPLIGQRLRAGDECVALF